MDNELDFGATAASETLADMAMTELSDGDLDQVSGGTGLNLADFSGLFQNSGSFFSQENLSMDQATFAGPGGAGTMSSIDYQNINSGSFQNIGFMS